MKTTTPPCDEKATTRFEQILDSSPDGIFVIDRERRLIHFNKACAAIMGRDPEEIAAEKRECSKMVDCHAASGESLAHELCPAHAVFSGESPHAREEMMMTNAAGEERWIETTYSPLVGEDGEVEFVVGMLRDVHDRKILEDKLHQSEKLASLGQLVAGIAHEIKNPLAIMLTSLDILENTERAPEERKEAGRFIRDEVLRLDDRLRSFLAFARPRETMLRPMVLARTVRKRVEALRPIFSGIDMKLQINRPQPIVMADEEQIDQVVMNLILNATEAIGGEGTIVVRTAPCGEHVVIEVEDSGPGVPEDFTPRIFDPFFTTKAEGTGLGLSICYQIVLNHHGSISISRGRQLSGACFRIRLPAASAPVEGGTCETGKSG